MAAGEVTAVTTEDGSAVKPKSTIVRVCNISGSVSEKQVRQLLENIAPLEQFVIYPRDKSVPPATKVAYARFTDPEAFKCAIHLTSTLLFDRPLIVVPMSSEKIPDEASAIRTATQLASIEISQLVVGGALVGSAINIPMNFGFPYMPPIPELPTEYNARRQNDVRRTIFVHNLHSDVTGEIILTLFSAIGEVRFIRLFDDPKKKRKQCAMVEFGEASSVYPALQFHEFPLFDVPIYVTFSKICIDREEEPRSLTLLKRSPSPPIHKSRSRSPSRSSVRRPSKDSYRRRRKNSRCSDDYSVSPRDRHYRRSRRRSHSSDDRPDSPRDRRYRRSRRHSNSSDDRQYRRSRRHRSRSRDRRSLKKRSASSSTPEKDSRSSRSSHKSKSRHDNDQSSRNKEPHSTKRESSSKSHKRSGVDRHSSKEHDEKHHSKKAKHSPSKPSSQK